MVNHKHKFIFLHIPKCAGITIGKALNKLTGVEEIYEGFKIHHDDFDEQIFKEYFVFTFVRNPWDRLYSQYKYREFLHKNYKFEDVVDNLETFFEIYYNTKVEDQKIGTIQEIADYYGEFIHLPSQYEFLQGKYSNNVDYLPYINYIGKYETLSEDFNVVCHKLGLGSIDLTVNNISPIEKSYKDVYNAELINKVKLKYAKDVEYFNYNYEI